MFCEADYDTCAAKGPDPPRVGLIHSQRCLSLSPMLDWFPCSVNQDFGRALASRRATQKNIPLFGLVRSQCEEPQY
jgi:hypothetical protein